MLYLSFVVGLFYAVFGMHMRCLPDFGCVIVVWNVFGVCFYRYLTAAESRAKVTKAAVRSEAVVLLVLICCLCTSHCLWGFCVGRFWYA